MNRHSFNDNTEPRDESRRITLEHLRQQIYQEEIAAPMMNNMNVYPSNENAMIHYPPAQYGHQVERNHGSYFYETQQRQKFHHHTQEVHHHFTSYKTSDVGLPPSSSPFYEPPPMAYDRRYMLDHGNPSSHVHPVDAYPPIHPAFTSYSSSRQSSSQSSPTFSMSYPEPRLPTASSSSFQGPANDRHFTHQVPSRMNLNNSMNHRTPHHPGYNHSTTSAAAVSSSSFRPLDSQEVWNHEDDDGIYPINTHSFYRTTTSALMQQHYSRDEPEQLPTRKASRSTYPHDHRRHVVNLNPDYPTRLPDRDSSIPTSLMLSKSASGSTIVTTPTHPHSGLVQRMNTEILKSQKNDAAKTKSTKCIETRNGWCHLCQSRVSTVFNWCPNRDDRHSICLHHLREEFQVTEQILIHSPRSAFSTCPVCSFRCSCQICSNSFEKVLGTHGSEPNHPRTNTRTTSELKVSTKVSAKDLNNKRKFLMMSQTKIAQPMNHKSHQKKPKSNTRVKQMLALLSDSSSDSSSRCSTSSSDEHDDDDDDDDDTKSDGVTFLQRSKRKHNDAIVLVDNSDEMSTLEVEEKKQTLVRSLIVTKPKVAMKTWLYEMQGKYNSSAETKDDEDPSGMGDTPMSEMEDFSKPLTETFDSDSEYSNIMIEENDDETLCRKIDLSNDLTIVSGENIEVLPISQATSLFITARANPVASSSNTENLDPPSDVVKEQQNPKSEQTTGENSPATARTTRSDDDNHGKMNQDLLSDPVEERVVKSPTQQTTEDSPDLSIVTKDLEPLLTSTNVTEEVNDDPPSSSSVVEESSTGTTTPDLPHEDDHPPVIIMNPKSPVVVAVPHRSLRKRKQRKSRRRTTCEQQQQQQHQKPPSPPSHCSNKTQNLKPPSVVQGNVPTHDDDALAQVMSPPALASNSSSSSLKHNPPPPVLPDYYSEDSNFDICATCQETGNLLCCDRCPRAFHLSCIGVTERDLPRGPWHCTTCQCPPTGLRQALRFVENNNETRSTKSMIDFVLSELVVHEFSVPFLERNPRAANPESVEEEEEELSSATTIATMTISDLRTKDYGSVDEFLADVELMWANCATVNLPTSCIVRMSHVLAEMVTTVVECIRP